MKTVPLNEEQKEKVEANQGLAHQVVQRACAGDKGMERWFDDLKQDSLVILCQAAKNYQSDHPGGASFCTYSYVSMFRQIRRESPRYFRSFQVTTPDDRDGSLGLLADPRTNQSALSDMKNDISTALESLPDFKRRAIVWRFGLDGDGPKQYDWIGLQEGITKQAACHRVQSGLKVMESVLEAWRER